jgi:thiol-disulfide isomerase/thioredoxin
MRWKILLIWLIFANAGAAIAGIPDELHPIVIKPPFSFSQRLIDLTDATQIAKEAHKPMLIYLGAEDCPPCKAYAAFLKDNVTALRPSLEKVVLVEIQTWLKGPDLKFKVGEKTYTESEFRVWIKDKSKSYLYPSFWLVWPDGGGTPVTQIGTTKELLTVEGHTRVFGLQ